MKKSKLNLILQIGFIITLAVTIALFAVGKIVGNNPSSEKYTKAIITGKYILDDGKSEAYTNKNAFEFDNSEKVVFKGHLENTPKTTDYLILSVENLWVDFKLDGKTVATNKRESKTNTPGYSQMYIDAKNITDKNSIEITFVNPYGEIDNQSVSNFFDNIILGEKDSLYEELINDKSLEIIIGLIISFLGIMTFSIAGILIPKLRNQNFAFGLVALVGGIYLLTDSIYEYLPLVIKNPIICFLIDEGCTYLLSVVFVLYILSNIKDKGRKAVVTCGALLVMAGTVTSFALQIFGIQDILKSEPIMYVIYALVIPMAIIVLLMEGVKKKSLETQLSILSFAPIIVANILELINIFFEFMPYRASMRIGILLTIIIQLVNLVIATKKSYDETLNYEKMQSELLKSRVTIMISQIQPHFLYNSLTSIAQLCEKNPKQAKTATIDFANYLRGNMNSIKDNSPVPFEKELSHLKTYLALEKMRFGEDLNIEYNIETDEFYIPSLTVQPLVENAVKHGVGMKEDGGTVTIATKEYDDRYEVVVSDDGVGFDTTKPNPDTSRTHIGIDNIKNRLSSMCNGEVIIESEIGKGTVSTIRIYKEEE